MILNNNNFWEKIGLPIISPITLKIFAYKYPDL